MLLLNSYHQGYEWSDQIVQGAQDAFAKSNIPVELSIEYLDWRRRGDAAQQTAFVDFLTRKYANTHYDAILVADDPAMHLALGYHDKLFPGAPVIFCGINEYHGSSAYVTSHPEYRDWLAGVLEPLDADGTIEVALRLHPGIRNLVTVGESAAPGFDEELAQRHPELRIRRISVEKMPLDHLIRELERLNQDTIVLLSAFTLDAEGNMPSLARSTRLVCERSPVPVYGLNRSELGQGIVGGQLNDPHEQGFAAASMIVSVFEGKHPRDLGIREEGASPYWFDARVLKRWRIPLSALPPGSRLVNQTHSFYEDHMELVWGVLGFLAAQSVAIVVLLVERRRRQRIQNALEESQRQRDIALAAGGMGMWRWERSTGLATWSVVHESLFGLEQGGYDGTEKTFFQLIHPSDREKVRAAMDISIIKNREYRCEYRVVWPNGEEHWLAAQGRVVKSADDMIEAITGVSWDITEARQVQESVARSEAELRLIMDSAPALIAYIGDDHRYRRVNHLHIHWLGVRPESLEGRTIESVLQGRIQGADLDAFIGENLSRVLTGFPVAFESNLPLRDGSGTRPIGVTYTPDRDPHGRIRGFVLLAHDLTEHKQTEQALKRQAQLLEQSNTDLQQFAYVASHDLQEPLRTVVGYSQLLANRYRGRLDSDADEFIEFLTDAGQRMTTMIRDLLAYSRVANAAKSQLVQVNLSDVVETARRNLSLSIAECGAELIAGDLPTVPGNQMQLVQLFQNLVGNAIKYRRLEVAPIVRITAERKEDCWELSVEDNGCGIPESQLERIFGLFKRLHGRDTPGTGVGLAICRKIVARHGGTIWAESNNESGATFRFRLPLRRTDAEIAREMPASARV